MKNIYQKLYVIIGLSCVILAGLLFLIFTDDSDPVISVPEPSSSPVTEVTPEPTAETVSTPESTPEAVIEDHSQDDDSLTRVVNVTHALDADYIPADLVLSEESEYNIYLRKEAEEQLKLMFKAAENDGIYLNLISGFRSYQYQTYLYKVYQDSYGKEYADQIDCHPGGSEHQLGLAVDLGTADHVYDLDTDFDTTDEFEWLNEHCTEYGYILRYPEGSEAVTGIMYSPWNFRYVGITAAKDISDSGLTMEEYFDLD